MCEFCEDHNLRRTKKPISIRKDEVYGAEAILLHHFKPCKENPTRDFWAIVAKLSCGNMYAEINYCPMCGRKLGENKDEV